MKPWASGQLEVGRGGPEEMHTFTNLLTHVIFSTRSRQPFIDTGLEPEPRAYVGGLVHELAGRALAVNGAADHIHMLISLPPTVSISDAMRFLKANSSRWLHEKWPALKRFGWQEGYGAFSVSQSNVSAVLKYIERQEEHHRKVSFQDEFLEFLKRHAIEYDERYIWR